MHSVIKNFELPGSQPNYNPDKSLNLNSVFLDLIVDVENKLFLSTSSLSGQVVSDNLTEVILDAVDMEIQAVRVNQKPVEYFYDTQKIHILLTNPAKRGDKLNISVDYLVQNPQMGLHFTGPNKHYPNKPFQAWSQGESEGSRYWFPCQDFPKQIVQVGLKVRVEEKYSAISNGKLVESKAINSKDKFYQKLASFLEENKQYKAIAKSYKLFHWKQEKPHSIYLTALAVGEFVEIKDKYKNIEVNYYTSKNKEKLLKLTGQKTPKMIDFYSKKFGVEYPWDKYAQIWVSDFIWGGMENTSMTINTDRAMVNKKALLDFPFAEVLVAHELAHQWFGDLIAIEHWADLWVKEGAVTYCESLWWRHEYGEDEFNYYRLQEQREYLHGEGYKRPVVTNVYRHVEDLYDRHSYTKAGTIFHMIQHELGEKTFELFFKTLLEDNRHKNVQAIDILRAIEKVSGKNLLPLFEQYIFTKGHPQFKVGYSWDQSSKLAKLSIKQKQVKEKDDFENLFRLKIPVAFGYLNGKKVTLKEVEIKVESPEQDFYFPLEKKPDFISFEHGNNHLKTVELDFPVPELENQLLHNPDLIARILAGQTLAKKNNLQSLKILEKAFEQEKFWAVRAEIISSVAKIRLNQTLPVLSLALKDKDARVRSSAISGLANFKTEESFEIVKDFILSEKESYFALGNALKTLGILASSLAGDFVSETITIFQEKLVEKDEWNEVIHSHAIAGLAELSESSLALETILEFTKLGVSQQLRQSAILNLGKASKNQPKYLVEKVLDKLEEISGEGELWFEMALIQSLQVIEHPKAIQVLSAIAETSIFGRTQRKAMEGIERVRSKLGNKEDILAINKDISQLKKENQELRSKLEKLESRGRK